MRKKKKKKNNDMKIKQDAGKSMSQQKGNLKHILRQMTMKKNYKKINEI